MSHSRQHENMPGDEGGKWILWEGGRGTEWSSDLKNCDFFQVVDGGKLILIILIKLVILANQIQ